MTYGEKWREDHPNEVWHGGLQCGVCYKPFYAQGPNANEQASIDMEAHLDTHEGFREYQRNAPSMREIRDSIHANCKGPVVRCPCICGCEEMGCDCWSEFCARCNLQIVRGNEVHGIPEPAAVI